MNKKDKNLLNILNICLRYSFLLVLGLFTAFSSYIYALLLPLTIYPVHLALNLFYESSINGAFILVNSFAIELIPACVAVSAYFLLLILNLTTPMSKKQRIYSLIFSLTFLLVLNILRIFALSVILINHSTSFALIHSIFWFSLSIIFVVGIWFLSVWLFKIKSMPVCTDIKLLLNRIK